MYFFTRKNISLTYLSRGFDLSSSFSQANKKWASLFAALLSKGNNEKFNLFALDATPTPRPHAETLSDHSYVHQSGTLGIPVAVGLQASVLVAIPEKREGEAKWTLALSVERISSKETPCQVAEKQLSDLSKLPYTQDSLSVLAADSGYSCRRRRRS